MVNLLKPTTGKVIGMAAIGVVVGIIALNHYQPELTGFGPDSTTNIERNAKDEVVKTVEIGQSGKSLWDWLSVLGVPLTLAVLGYWLQQLQQQRATEEAREEVLQAYFDRISTLLVDKNLIAIARKVQEEESSSADDMELVNAAADVIRGRTLSILRRFEHDPKRKEDVIRFLADTEIIYECELNLSGTNLAGVNLIGANLSRGDLSKISACKVILTAANLSGANLYDAHLSGAHLRGADFYRADLSEANLTRANLSGANLSGANLSGANLKGADFRGATNWTDEHLSQAKLCFTKLPEGSKLNPNRDCEADNTL